MQVGSIVVVKKGGLSNIKLGYNPSNGQTIKWIPKDDEETQYVIRTMKSETVKNTTLVGAGFEEGYIGDSKFGREVVLDINLLIELLPPAENILEEILENELELSSFG